MTQYIRKDKTGTFYYKDRAMKILHRDGGPAAKFADGSRHWYQNDKLHREDGPALEWATGYKEWYLNGISYNYNNWLIEVARLRAERLQKEKDIASIIAAAEKMSAPKKYRHKGLKANDILIIDNKEYVLTPKSNRSAKEKNRYVSPFSDKIFVQFGW